MWIKGEWPKYKRVWIAVNGVVHPAMYDGKMWRTPNGEYSAIAAWCPLKEPEPYLEPRSYTDQGLVSRI